MPLPPNARIIEIGDKPFVKQAFPREVVYFSTRPEDLPAPPGAGTHAVALGTMLPLRQALRDPAVALIVCHPTFHAPWQPAALLRMIFNRRLLTRPFPLIPAIGPQLLRRGVAAPVAVVDHDDLPLINRQNRFLLERATLYFKRELPVDRWQVFLKTFHANLPTPRFREKPRNLARLEKLRPISLGLPLPVPPEAYAASGVEKRADVFFAGRHEATSFVRKRGLAEVLALRAEGVVIDIPEAPLPPEEFRRRMAAAWLCWSPEGLGWDCFRHYEAAACGSVPLINQPTIERYAPLVDGKHAIYYDPEPGGLARAVRAALADRAALQRIAEAGRAHVLRHHTPAALAEYIVTATLAAVRSDTQG